MHLAKENPIMGKLHSWIFDLVLLQPLQLFAMLCCSLRPS